LWVVAWQLAYFDTAYWGTGNIIAQEDSTVLHRSVRQRWRGGRAFRAPGAAVFSGWCMLA
jgi:hypothetical protein